MRNIDKKCIAVTPASKSAGFLDELVDGGADGLEDVVAVGSAVELVDDAEAVDIEHDGVHRAVVILRIKALAVLEEEFPVEQSGQLVTLGLVDDDAVLGKLDGTAHSRTDDFGRIIGLCDEIRSAHPQAFNLRILLGSEHDDRDAAQLAVGADGFEQTVAVELRHMQIEHDQRELLYAGANDIERLQAVPGVNDLEQIL